MPDRQPFRFKTRIRFIDTDTSGRIHYTAMFRYFESAEIEFMRTLECNTRVISRSPASMSIAISCLPLRTTTTLKLKYA